MPKVVSGVPSALSRPTATSVAPAPPAASIAGPVAAPTMMILPSAWAALLRTVVRVAPPAPVRVTLIWPPMPKVGSALPETLKKVLRSSRSTRDG